MFVSMKRYYSMFKANIFQDAKVKRISKNLKMCKKFTESLNVSKFLFLSCWQLCGVSPNVSSAVC